MSWPWSQLGLPGPSDLSQIRHAYAEKLKTTHPEDDPEGFQRLHSAYQLASRMAREQKRRKSPFPHTEDAPAPHSGSGMREDDIMEIEVPEEEPPRKEQDFDFDELLREKGEQPRRPREEERDFDFERLFAEGEAERAEARRRRGEERRRAQERERQARQQQRLSYEQELRGRFSQEENRWQSTETILHTIEMMYNAGTDEAGWQKFFQGPLFQQWKGSLDVVFGLEDFVCGHPDWSQRARLALFLTYGFDKGVSRPELRPLYQMLLPAWRAEERQKRKKRADYFWGAVIGIALVFFLAGILASPWLPGFILLGILAVQGLNRGWLRRRPKHLGGTEERKRRNLVLLVLSLSAAVLVVVGLGVASEAKRTQNPRQLVCGYLEEDFGRKFRYFYDGDMSDYRFSNVFAPLDEPGDMFLAGPDGERDPAAGRRGYTTNYPDMMVLWALEDFAREHSLKNLDQVNRNQNLEPWNTAGTYLIELPLRGAEEIITGLGELLERLSGEDWYRTQPPEFKLVLCGDQMKEGRLILWEYQSDSGPLDTEEVLALYQEEFAHAYCAQLLKELELDRDFVHDGAQPYTMSNGGMAELEGKTCVRLYGLDESGAPAMEYWVSTGSGDIYCLPAGFWEGGGTEKDIRFYDLIQREEMGKVFLVHCAG